MFQDCFRYVTLRVTLLNMGFLFICLKEGFVHERQIIQRNFTIFPACLLNCITDSVIKIAPRLGILIRKIVIGGVGWYAPPMSVEF